MNWKTYTRRAATMLAALMVCAGGVRGGNPVWPHVDPRIGSCGLGRTFPGPCMPFGMAKPGPDCTVKPNAGWAPMPEVVTGFSQTHVSGTGGGQKYGNVLIQPFLEGGCKKGEGGCKGGEGRWEMGDVGGGYEQRREREDIALGYYATTFENGIRTEITAAERCAFYRIGFPKGGTNGLLIDGTHYLGKSSIPDLREAQQFVGAEVEVVSNHEVCGYTRIRGGWNNGDAYTVYFWMVSDEELEGRGERLEGRCERAEGRREKGEEVQKIYFSADTVNLKIGISYISSQQAQRNIPATDFDSQLTCLRQAWEQQLSKIQIEGTAQQKRMFYTALYHTMLMPVDKTGENPKWNEAPYYDDYYAIWDTYRTSTPLLTLLDEQREADIVNSLLNIYRREGYMPDARSGDCNGRTQGGSNGEIVIADAFAKGLRGIDYELALEAMLKDADVPPGGNEEKEGRGGLAAYNRLGYIPYGTDRAGNRTIEYAYDDWCIAQVAKGLGRMDVYERFMRQSENWKNLWRGDYEWGGMRGFIMPKDEQGRWMDSVPWGHSKVFHPRIPYTPVTKVAPWYLPWWSTFFYEALSAEYSLSIPHDVPALIDSCGGGDAFRKRIDTFFDEGHYNVANEPSFLTPLLYHWIGRPDLSTKRAHGIVQENYSDRADGLPGNDDSGAMSSWLAFQMMGFYPNAGQDYYLLTAPMVPEYTFQLCNGRRLHAMRRGKGDVARRILLNGAEISDARLSHQQLMEGGELVFEMAKSKPEPVKWLPPTVISCGETKQTPAPFARYDIHYTLNRQFRTWPLTFAWRADSLVVGCKEAVYVMHRDVAEHAAGFCWAIPADGAVYHQVEGTFAFISRDALHSLTAGGSFVYDGITWRSAGREGNLLHVRADVDGTEMWINADGELPIVVELRHNPLGIDWKTEPKEHVYPE